MNFVTFILRIVLTVLGFAMAILAAIFVIFIGGLVLLWSVLTGRAPKLQVYTNRREPDAFGRPPMRDVTPASLNEG